MLKPFFVGHVSWAELGNPVKPGFYNISAGTKEIQAELTPVMLIAIAKQAEAGTEPKFELWGQMTRMGKINYSLKVVEQK